MSFESLAYDLYFLCTEFMVDFANALDVTYRDANSIILFGFIPAVLVLDIFLFAVLFMISAGKKANRNEQRQNVRSS